MAKQRTTNQKASKDQVEAAIRKIEAYWRRGNRYLDKSVPRQSPRDRSAEEALRAARRFAERYTEEQLDRLFDLMRENHCALSVSHVVRLCSIHDRRTRKALQDRSIRGRWSKRRLDTEIKKRYGKHTQLGRVVPPETVEDACVQIIDLCDRWTRLCQQLECARLQDGTVPMDGLPDMSKRKLREMKRRAVAMREMLDDHLHHDDG